MVRAILLVSMIGMACWYLVAGLTGEDPGDGTSPWLEHNLVPIIAVSFLLPMFLIACTPWRVNSNSRALRDAPIGIGTVTGVRRTGASINDQPQVVISMTVRTADGQRFDSVAKEIVGIDEVAALAPGIVLPVRYRPGNTALVELDKSADKAAAQAVYDEVRVHSGLTTPRLLEITRRGVRATAVVATARATGRLVDGNPELVLTLLVTRPDGTSFETTVDKVITANLVGHVQVGRVLTVHYLPGEEHEVALQLPANPQF